MDFRRPLAVVTPTLEGDVLAVLSHTADSLTGRQVHALVGHSSEQGVRKALKRLVRQGIVSSTAAGRAQLYELNRAHLAAPHIEALASLRRALIAHLRETFASWPQRPAAAVLFGSVARGEAGVDSDVDLLVVRPTGCDADSARWREQLDDLELSTTSRTGNSTRVLEYGQDDLVSEAAAEPVFLEALRDGIDLAGSRRSLRRLVQTQ